MARQKCLTLLSLATLFCFNLYAQDTWTWLNPHPQGNYLTDLVAFNESSMLAVGFDGTVLRTNNAGEDWEIQQIDMEGIQHITAVYFLNETLGWAISFPNVLKTVDGGITWEIYETEAEEFFTDIFFVDAKIGYISGNDGQILKSINGGRDWQVLGSVTDNSLLALHFVTGLRGWAVGVNGTMIETSDGGLSWAVHDFMTSRILHSVTFSSTSTGWIVGDQGMVYKTIDAGESWHLQTAFTQVDLVDASFANASVGSMSARDNQANIIFKTEDGGATWAQQALPEIGGISTIVFSDSQFGWGLGGGSGRIIRTVNGGAQWGELTQGSHHAIVDIQPFGSGNALAISGWEGSLLQTNNSWQTHQVMTDLGENNFLAFDFINDHIGWAIKRSGLIYKTEDAAAGWTHQPASQNEYLRDIDFVDTQHGWAVGDAGTVLATKDGGVNWDNQDSQTEDGLQSVFFLDENNGWTCGRKWTVRRTTDGGATWQVSATKSPLAKVQDVFFSIHFVDAQTGWVVGDRGRIHKTTDGGTTWTEQSIPVTETLLFVRFQDRNNGWVSGSRGVLLHTQDGGTTWSQIPTPTSKALSAFYFDEFGLGYFYGANGTILRLNSDELTSATSVNPSGLPQSIHLQQNYPNPFNPTTTIAYELNASTPVKLYIHNMLGQAITTLVNEFQTAGSHFVEWNGRNSYGQEVPTGIYFYSIETTDAQFTRKMLLLR